MGHHAEVIHDVGLQSRDCGAVRVADIQLVRIYPAGRPVQRKSPDSIPVGACIPTQGNEVSGSRRGEGARRVGLHRQSAKGQQQYAQPERGPHAKHANKPASPITDQ